MKRVLRFLFLLLALRPAFAMPRTKDIDTLTGDGEGLTSKSGWGTRLVVHVAVEVKVEVKVEVEVEVKVEVEVEVEVRRLAPLGVRDVRPGFDPLSALQLRLPD